MTTTDDEQFRAQLLAAAQRIQAEKTARENGFRAWMCTRLGLAQGVLCDQAEAIIASDNPKELTDEQLSLMVQFDAGLPPTVMLTDDQIEIAANALLGSAAL